MKNELPSVLEAHISQIPALCLLQNLGWQLPTPAATGSLRGGKLINIMLDGMLIKQLRNLNPIRSFGLIGVNQGKVVTLRHF